MHVAFLNVPIEFYSPVSGGALATVIVQMAREFLRRGHRVTVLTPVNGDPLYEAGTVVPVAIKTASDLHRVRRKLSALRRKLQGWDLPYYEFYLRSYSRELARLAPAPDAVVLMNDLVAPRYVKRAVPQAKIFTWFHNEWRTNSRNLPEAVACTEKFVTCSDYIKTWMSRTTGIPLGKFVTAHNGVDLGEFFPAENFLEDTEKLRVLFVGRIDANKGPDITADAVAALQAEGLPISLSVAGGIWFYGHGNEMADPFFRSLKTKMDKVGARHLGHVTRPHVPDVFRQHDVVTVLSRANEPFGLVALEAMAAGCAVVASNRGGLPEACDGAAMLVNPDDLASVVNCLRMLGTDRALLREYKRKSVERAQRSPWAACATALEQAMLGPQPMEVAA